jgi:hypothetical protein
LARLLGYDVNGWGSETSPTWRIVVVGSHSRTGHGRKKVTTVGNQCRSHWGRTEENPDGKASLWVQTKRRGGVEMSCASSYFSIDAPLGAKVKADGSGRSGVILVRLGCPGSGETRDRGPAVEEAGVSLGSGEVVAEVRVDGADGKRRFSRGTLVPWVARRRDW